MSDPKSEKHAKYLFLIARMEDNEFKATWPSLDPDVEGVKSKATAKGKLASRAVFDSCSTAC